MVEYSWTARPAWRCCDPPGFPRTHYFAQARSVFAVAAYRCHEVFDPPDSVTLWRLPEAIEEEFEANGSTGSIKRMNGTPFFHRLESSEGKRPQDRASRIRCSHKSGIRNVFTTSPLGGRACRAPIRTVLWHRSGHRIARPWIRARGNWFTRGSLCTSRERMNRQPVPTSPRRSLSLRAR